MMNDPFALFRRQLAESLRSEERVAWLGRSDTRPLGDCLPSGTWVLCHPRFPGQFRVDHGRHRAEFRRHGFTWTDAAAEELGALRFAGAAEGSVGDAAVFTADQRRRSETAARKELSDLDLNLRSALGARFPWSGREAWWDGVVIPLARVNGVERVADLSEAFAERWETVHRDPGLEYWPDAFRAEFLKHNRVVVHRLGSTRGRTVHVVTAYVSPLVLAFASEEAVATLGDGLRVEWRAWDIGVGRLIREVYQRWQESQPLKAEFTYFSIGLDVRHATIPESLVPVTDRENWECLWVADGGERMECRTPPRAGFKRHRRDFTDLLVPETREEQLCRVRSLVDRYRKEFFRGSINIRLLREQSGYRRSVLRDLLLELEARDGVGAEGYAVRLPKGKSKDQLDDIEVVRPTSKEGRSVLAKWYRPSWWFRLLWLGLPTAAATVLAHYVGQLTQGKSLPLPATVGLSLGMAVTLWLVKEFARKRAEESEDE
jgi:hypothetical protein